MATLFQQVEMVQAARSSQLVIPTSTKDPDALGSNVISIALISPEGQLRQPVINALAELRGSVTREFLTYPELDDVSQLLGEFDVIIVELDSNPEYALDLVETICANSSATVMVYSTRVYPDMLVRCMRAGAREYLSLPITSATIAEAMVRVSVRRHSTAPAKKTGGKLIVFTGAKGGSGVTTVTCNFAVSVAIESGQRVLLIDLNLPLGDVALELGINAQYSTLNALQEFHRLDFNFLSRLLSKHSSGLSVLAAPDTFTDIEASSEAIERLLTVCRQNFDYVIVDAGSKVGSISKVLFREGSTVYLVTQVGISELRNSNRLISQFLKESGANIEIVLNRYTPRSLVIDDESIARALTMPVHWKIPNDYSAVRSAQNTTTPLALKDSPISRVISQMARAASGLAPGPEKKRRFGVFK